MRDVRRNADAPAVPLVLLPYRIETRFMAGTTGPELWLRVFPDQIAIDAHQPNLTADEIGAGTVFWNALWSAGIVTPPGEESRGPWRALAQRFGAQRAAYIARQLTPTNLSQRPVAASATPVPAASLPVLVPRAGAGDRAPFAALLPDRWTVALYRNDAAVRHDGPPIASDLAVGLTPGGPPAPKDVPVDPGMRWLVDFDTAVAAGMALRIPLSAQERSDGFDRIVVFGVRAGATSADLAALLDAHHYTDGLAFVAQGTPAHTTPDASAAFARSDPHYDRSFDVELASALATPNADADGSRAATALGVPAATFDHIERSGGFGVASGRAMFAALWPATLGYFASQMMANVFAPSDIESARRFSTTYAIPRGVVPALRVGKIPYGILPVTTLREPEAPERQASFESALAASCARLLPTWVRSAQATPRAGATSDPDKDLMATLEMEASAMRYFARSAIGDEFLWNLLQFVDPKSPGIAALWKDNLTAARAMLAAYGFAAWDPFVAHVSLRDRAYPVTDPSVHAKPLSETDALENDASVGTTALNYIQWIRTASVAALRAGAYPGTQPSALLYKLLRQSAILAYAGTAGDADVAAGRLTREAIREPELLNMATATATARLTAYDVLDRPAAKPGVNLTWAQYLPTSQGLLDFPQLGDVHAGFERLASLPTAELDRLLGETLDACGHRLDVWATAVANARLDAFRNGPNGPQTQTAIGGFGWVENVRPAEARPVADRQTTTVVERIDAARSRRAGRELNARPPVAPLRDNGGYIAAPSIAQAEVAAVLRNGYMTHRGGPNEGLLSIDLCSDRVRDALEIVDGVRAGQRLGALLGYRLEAGLSAPALQTFVAPLRARFPLVGTKLTPAPPPAESVAYDDVVDAVALQQAWTSGTFTATSDWGVALPLAGTPERAAIVALITALDDSLRALAELSMAESVFQVMQGNFGRAGGLLDAASRGAYPPDAAVVTTPRTGIDITHRVVILVAGTPEYATGWGSAGKPRAAAEPVLDAWVSQQLPDPSTVTCTVAWTASGIAGSRSVTLAELSLCPLDVLALSNANDETVRSELEQRIVAAAALPPGAGPATIALASATAGGAGISDVLTVAGMWREVVGAGRALGPADLAEPEKSAKSDPTLVDMADLSARANAALAAFEAVAGALAAALPGLPATASTVRTALRALADFGTGGAYAASGADDASLGLRATPLAQSVTERLTAATKTPLSATSTVADVTAVFTAIFGADFKALPHASPPDLAALRAALSQSPGLIAATEAGALEVWLQQLAHVRPGVARYDLARMATSLLQPEVALPTPTVLQLPLPPTLPDRWLASAFPAGTPPQSGRVAIAAFAGGDLATVTAFTGLLVDEWPERIPRTQETTAVSFHYEEPKARAPQSVLVAVPEPGQEAWDAGAIQSVLESAFDVARARTVDSRTLAGAGAILPALYFGFNIDEETPSLRLQSLERIRDVAHAVRP